MASIGILIAIIVYLVMMVYVGRGRQGRFNGPFLSGWKTAGTVRDGYECRGIGHEQLAADGTSWSGLSDRYF